VDHIGRYQILEEIGRGAMGIVYRAQDPAIGRVIAIKTIRLTDLTDADERARLRERLFREAQSAGSLSHPNIVTIYDIAEENGNACIFMELVNGPPLEQLLNSRTPPDKESIFGFLRQTANALDYAHRKGIVHRDIKPANIMIHDDGQAKITDFGVAKTLSHQMTQSGTMMGTPNYMSPEQVQGLAVDGRADQFALAVIAYEVLTGEKPFAGEYLPTLLYKIVREDPVSPQRLNPALDPAVETVFRKALAKDSQQRYATCAEFVTALTEACNRSPGWEPMPRGSSQSMPTVAGAPPPALPLARGGGGLLGQSPPALSGSQTKPPGKVQSDRNPLVRSLVWVLVGIGLVGLVLLGAQKLLFNNPGTVSQASQEQAPAPPATQEPAETTAKPSPIGQPPTPEQIPGQTAKPTQPVSPELPADARRSPAPPAQATAGERTVQLLTEPPGAHIVIDGNSSLACTTPCMLSLPGGRHTMSTQLDGYRPYPKVINVPQDGDQFLKLSKTTGTLSVTSNPPGATIQLNGEVQKQTTPANFTVAPGTYRVRVTRDGVPLDFDVELKDGEFQHRNVNFQ
jgi:serine/threonine protein kinase